MGFNSGFKGLREEHGLRVLEKAVPRCMFGPRREEEEEPRDSCIAGSFMICILLPTECYWGNQMEDGMGWAGHMAYMGF